MLEGADCVLVMLARTQLWLVLCVFSAPRLASAQTDAAAAEALFQQGKALLEQGPVSEACSKLGESYRLDPATGALLLLAHCHEREGKLASAWAELSEAASRAHKEGSTEREAFARERARALAPRLSRLRIEVSPSSRALASLRVERDGAEVGRASFGAEIPVDGGAHTVSASAAGHKSWETTVRVRNEGDTLAVTVPALEPAAVRASAHEGAAAGSLASEKGLGPMQIAGVVCGGAGLVALGIGGYLSLKAVDKKNESDDLGCENNRCPDDAAERRREALTLADGATIAMVSGAALVGGGVTLFLLGRRTPRASSESAQVQLSPAFGGLTLRGAF